MVDGSPRSSSYIQHPCPLILSLKLVVTTAKPVYNEIHVQGQKIVIWNIRCGKFRTQFTTYFPPKCYILSSQKRIHSSLDFPFIYRFLLGPNEPILMLSQNAQ